MSKNDKTTDEGEKVKAASPVMVRESEDGAAEKARILSPSETEKLVGELEPGETGWLPLDDEGNPSGPAVREKPEGKSAPVQVPAARPDPNLMTTAGAPISKAMEPHPSQKGAKSTPEDE